MRLMRMRLMGLYIHSWSQEREVYYIGGNWWRGRRRRWRQKSWVILGMTTRLSMEDSITRFHAIINWPANIKFQPLAITFQYTSCLSARHRKYREFPLFNRPITNQAAWIGSEYVFKNLTKLKPANMFVFTGSVGGGVGILCLTIKRHLMNLIKFILLRVSRNYGQAGANGWDVV